MIKTFGLCRPLYTSQYQTHLLRFMCTTVKPGGTETMECNTVQEGKAEVLIECNTVKEGKAEVLFPKNVFYNPVQEFNRDLSVAVISQFAKDRLTDSTDGKKSKQSKVKQESDCMKVDQKDEKKDTIDIVKDEKEDTSSTDKVKDEKELELEPGKKYDNGIKILEGLSASGLRSVRFGLEIPGVNSIIANDFDENAVSFINKNIEKNNLQELVSSSCDDAAMVMYRNRNPKEHFDVIDLDPYGSPSKFLDATVQAVKDGGLLCITCTDAAVLCGNAGETCYSKYGAMSLRTTSCHEMGLRIILQCIESHANRYSRYIVPLISLSIDFYFRVFVRVHTGQGKVKRSASKMAMVYSCNECKSFSLQRIGAMIPTKGNNFKYSPATGPPVTDKCEHCGSKHHIGGPIWADPICDIDFIDSVINRVNDNKDSLKTSERIVGMLTLQKEELQEVPLYFKLDSLFGFVHAETMPLIQFRSALLNAGYKVSLSHAMKNSIKTDAPHNVLWDIIRAWVKGHPVKPARLEDTAIKTLLEKECSTKVSFEEHPEANPQSRKDKLLRYQANPEPHWGPKAKATRTMSNELQEERKRKLQGKKGKQKDQIEEEEENDRKESDGNNEEVKKRKLCESELTDQDQENSACQNEIKIFAGNP
ncbi:tRNA (guanine(26)-N(2))-dimethyltransferase-like isoform X2 [Mytilus californianus]|uniref:tRNA (guanine(26)-N(2))-dimethyltransferase-like isoform X2 n=1 Tax=Mytilus californianus TaxID=6549 RepID=UPI002245570C|nr:tRNA (guanine(26)-N(2))-dimethyltransferase-like isoform X2 [Mytilus californianus]